MMISIRLDEELDRLVRHTAKVLGRTRSDVVKASLREYCGRALRTQETFPFDVGRDLFGRAGSGRGDLSTRGRKYILEMLHAKQHRRAR